MQSTLVLPTTPKPGATVETIDLSALAALQTLYEQGPPPLVLEPMLRAFETTADCIRYMLPVPNEIADTDVPVDVWIYCLSGAGDQEWTILGGKANVELKGWNGPYERDLLDGALPVAVELAPNDDYSGDPVFVECVAIFHRRSRTRLPEAEFDNGATPVDTDQLADDLPVSVHRIEAGRSLAVECYRRQYQSALQCSRLADNHRHRAELEIPESVAQASVSLSVNVYGVEGGELHVSAEGQTVDLDTSTDDWESATITLATARDGQLRPHRLIVDVELDVDSTIEGLSLLWSFVAP